MKRSVVMGWAVWVAVADVLRAEVAVAPVVPSFDWKELLFSVLWSLLFIGLFLVGFRLLGRGLRRMRQLVLKSQPALPKFGAKQVELISPVRVKGILLGSLRWLHGAGLLLLLYLVTSAVLGAFEATRPFSKNLLTYIADPVHQAWAAFVAFVPNLLFIAVGIVIVYYLLAAVEFIFNEVGKGSFEIEGFEQEWAEPTYKIVRFLILVLGVVILAPYLPGAKSPAFQGVSIFLGLIISLSSSSALSNIISGVILIYTGNLRQGDRVRIGDCSGVVVERTLLVTRIRTPKNVNVTIPNAQVLSGRIENETSRDGQPPRILHSTVTIGYDVPWNKVHELLLGAVKDGEGVLQDPAPFVLQTSLDDFYVSYQLNFATGNPGRQERTLSAVHAKVQEAFAAAGVEILSPHYEARRDGSAPALPKAE